MKSRQATPDELTVLFEAYRSACPDPEAGSSFTPGLWARIEGRKRSTQLFGVVARRLLAAAAALTLAMAVMIYHPFERSASHNTNTYLEALADDHLELGDWDVSSPGDRQ